MDIKEKLVCLRSLMIKNNIDYYYIPTSDYHLSEYVGDYFKERAFMSGFNGSAGYLLIGLNDAYLWTDGRYFLQAEKDLKNTTITLMKMGEENVLTIFEFLKKYGYGKTIAFDGRCVPSSFGYALDFLGLKIISNVDLVNEIWENRPALPNSKAYILDLKYAGEDINSKINKLIQNLDDESSDLSIITSLDDIMWILNLRGDDVYCNPVLLSYLIIYKDHLDFYIDKNKLNDEIIKYLNNSKVYIKEYNDIYDDLKLIKNKKILLDKNKVNYQILSLIKDDNKIISKENKSTYLKAIKNDIEIKNTKYVHELDAVAMIKFIYWLKNNVGKIKITELSASDKLLSFRKENEYFKDISFETIAGYGPHGAIIHYAPNEETNIEILPNNLLLVDSGGHYLYGTTDITRTIVLGEISNIMKRHFTLVLKSHLNLLNAKFLKGTTGATLDFAARQPLWQNGLDYKHGTGHGVGYLLNVHEGPQRINYNARNVSIDAGMITSDEPGLYLENEYGIRHESLILAIKDKKNEFGEFLKFEPLTLVPFDKDGIDKSLLNEEEVNILNNYHKLVYDKISPYLDNELKAYLKELCKEI